MNEELVSHRIGVLETRVNNHSERIDKLEQNNAELKIQLQDLCENIKSLVSTMKWFIGITVSVCSIILTILGWYITSK